MIDLAESEIDVVEITRLAGEQVRGPALLTEAKLRALEDAATAAAAEFLPDWSDLQQSVNRGRGDAEGHVRMIATQVAEARGTLLAGSAHTTSPAARWPRWRRRSSSTPTATAWSTSSSRPWRWQARRRGRLRSEAGTCSASEVRPRPSLISDAAH